jgi:outer membrane receptor protein involved in Fe transport
VAGRGDLFETTNEETAFGLSGSVRSVPMSLGGGAEVIVEPGVQLRFGQTDQTKSLLEPSTLAVWDRRIDAGLQTLDAGAYVDADLRLWKRLRLSGGPRVDLLSVSIDDRLASGGTSRTASGVSVGPRATAEYAFTPGFTGAVSYGEGFRSLDASLLREGDAPYSKVRSGEVGLRAQDPRHRYTTTLALFQTHVGNELVFVAEEGGLDSQNASTRQGVVSSFLARPVPWFLGSSSLSVTSAEYDTRVPGVRHHVPNVPPILLRADASIRGSLGRVASRSVEARIGAGYTFISARRLNDALTTRPDHVLNVGAQVRYGAVEVALDGYNVLDRKYPDSADRYVSNWSLSPGQQRASLATHYVAAAPASVVGSVSIYF